MRIFSLKCTYSVSPYLHKGSIHRPILVRFLEVSFVGIIFSAVHKLIVVA